MMWEWYKMKLEKEAKMETRRVYNEVITIIQYKDDI